MTKCTSIFSAEANLILSVLRYDIDNGNIHNIVILSDSLSELKIFPFIYKITTTLYKVSSEVLN